MDGQHSDRCDSKELDIHPGFWIKMGYPTHNPSDHDTTHTPDSQVSEVSMLSLHIKLLNLRREKKELLYINKKWAEQYSSLKQHFEHQITELNRRLKSYEQRKEEKEKRMEDFSSLTDNTKESAQETELKSRLQKADREIKGLKRQCDTLTSRGQQQVEEIGRLNKVLQRAQNSLAVQQESQQTEENIWKHQALVYKEDFLKERKDRDKLKEKYAELEKKYKKIHADLHMYKAQVRWDTSTYTGPSPHT
ncbi:TNFAIP3-interacting protein 1-like [Colossoma macropomum]|uniref:TNFAIP3-interacting protein 1-like n=1 Tax=Colossoma macropomum TaxID=42526 RepID=UPI001863B253|nr:TNFAIP3-interacting protein 1-like [Colossoma macropomum]XP_036416561.1 TNFAIP3-interacting protein 1-like [Colossoma macropomum]XP_036416562.1 TNFAIP3-interacting protein 1-like [Colossoma macropomum]